MLFLFLLSCVDHNSASKKSQEPVDGEILLENYNTAICNVYLQDTCIDAFSNCNEPIANFGDWVDCMNSQYISQTHCTNLPLLFEEAQPTILECIDVLQSVNCQEEPEGVCIGDDAIFQVETCGEVLNILLNNCSAFGP
jgi:hypothetical protein